MEVCGWEIISVTPRSASTISISITSLAALSLSGRVLDERIPRSAFTGGVVGVCSRSTGLLVRGEHHAGHALGLVVSNLDQGVAEIGVEIEAPGFDFELVLANQASHPRRRQRHIACSEQLMGTPDQGLGARTPSGC